MKDSKLLKNVSILFWKTIFKEPKSSGERILEKFLDKKFTRGRLNDLNYIRFKNYLFIEQNPKKKNSKWAGMAKKGHKIIWVIDTKRNEYIARVIDKKFKVLGKKE